MKYIPYSRQDINDDDIASAIEVLKSDFLTTGPKISEFENAVANYCNTRNVIALSNGTASLHIALMAMGIGQDSLVWTSPISFVASANVALYVGSEIDFVDVEINTGNIAISALEEKLISAKKANKLPDVIIIVHFTGSTCDMEKITKLSEEYNFKIIEDAAHALGGKYQNGEHVGNGKYSDATSFSFHPVKSIATGEGGAIISNDDNLSNKMRKLVSHGITRDKNLMIGQPHGDWYYQQLELGYNYRLTDIQAALGVSQLKRLNNFIKKRFEIAQIYQNELANLPINLPILDKNSAWHLYIIRLKNEAKISRYELFNKLREANIGVNVHYIPIYTQPYYKNLGFKEGYCPNAERFYDSAISIPIFPKLQTHEQEYVIAKLKEFLS